MNQCRSCHAPIIWTETVNGKAMPVDVEHDDERGNVVLTLIGRDARYLADVYPDNAAARGADAPSLYTSHFTTCPNAAQHRRSR